MSPRILLAFGDSNTHGTLPMAAFGEIARLGRETRWTGHMARALSPAAGVPGWEVIEEGQPGRTTVHDDPIEGPHRNGLSVLPALLESHRPLDLVLVMLGTNDLKARFSVTPTDIALSLEKLIAVIRASGAGPHGAAPAVLLVSPPPIAETGCLAGIFTGGAAKSRHLAAAIGAASARAGVAFVDAGRHVAVSPVDGIHYEAADHTRLGAALTAAVREHFP